jgi:hypothetical protein
MTPTTEQGKQAFEHVKIVAECIAVAGSIPSGHLYAMLNAKGFSLEVYQRIIDVLKNAKLVSESHHLLKWEG